MDEIVEAVPESMIAEKTEALLYFAMHFSPAGLAATLPK
jgi:hypothetical protein